MAVSFAGNASPAFSSLISSHLLQIPDQQVAILALPALLRDVLEPAIGSPRNGPPFQISLAVGAWSLAHNAPVGIFITNRSDLPPGGPAYELHQVERSVAPILEPGMAPGPNGLTLAAARMLAAQQRLVPHDGHLRVGGPIDIVTINANGSSIETFDLWNDHVGASIKQQANAG